MNGYHFGYTLKFLEKTLVMVHADQPNSFVPKFAELVTRAKFAISRFFIFLFLEIICHIRRFFWTE
jgi:hypothetical protein